MDSNKNKQYLQSTETKILMLIDHIRIWSGSGILMGWKPIGKGGYLSQENN